MVVGLTLPARCILDLRHLSLENIRSILIIGAVCLKRDARSKCRARWIILQIARLQLGAIRRLEHLAGRLRHFKLRGDIGQRVAVHADVRGPWMALLRRTNRHLSEIYIGVLVLLLHY